MINYDKLDNLYAINITREFDRLKIVNNTDGKIYLILDKFFDKRIYEVDDIKYVNFTNLNGKYTVYLKMDDKVYKTDYYVEV